jgi:PAS domain S-box-containing protein
MPGERLQPEPMADELARIMATEWRATLDAISDGLAVVDGEGRIRRANAALARLLERPVSELANVPCVELWGSLPAERQPFIRAMQNRRRESIELEYSDRLLSVTVDPMFDASGEPVGAVHIVRDMTDKRRLEEQFRESQKFETIGTLAAGVAHDFNNLLTSIMGNASLVLDGLPDGNAFREKLEDVVRAGQRAAELTHQLLAYSGKGRHFMQKVELSSLVERVQTLIEATVPKKVNLEIRLQRNLPRIDADPNQVQQVVLNLVSNAAEAIGTGAGSIEVITGAEANGYVYLEVRDTGCGMDTLTKTRIFDPFFTTKFTGRGLGLAAVAGIARSHKGNIQVNSTPGKGSTFRISFPADEAPTSVTLEPEPHTIAAEGGTVLVVDDEEIVRRVASAALESRGYKVRIAADGMDAVKQAREFPDIAVVLLDLTMPVMGGEEAIDEIAAARPGVRVIVSTGYERREAVARFGRKPVAAYLQKPYTSRQLAEKIESVLAELRGQR